MTKTQVALVNIDISQIVNEVKKNGFYSSFCDDLVHGVGNHKELILVIKMIAKSAGLTVSFNAAESVCIFEDLTA